jgi:hypothetical protein
VTDVKFFVMVLLFILDRYSNKIHKNTLLLTMCGRNYHEHHTRHFIHSMYVKEYLKTFNYPTIHAESRTRLMNDAMLQKLTNLCVNRYHGFV